MTRTPHVPCTALKQIIKKVINMQMGVTSLIHTYLWETPNKTEMTTSVQRAGRIGPYPKVNNQYDWLSNTLFKIWLDYRAQRFYLLYRNHLYHYHSTFPYTVYYAHVMWKSFNIDRASNEEFSVKYWILDFFFQTTLKSDLKAVQLTQNYIFWVEAHL